MLDSLVRVSRRGKENHFASITRANLNPSQGSKAFAPAQIHAGLPHTTAPLLQAAGEK